MIKYFLILWMCMIGLSVLAQQKTGIASYYHSKFEGRKTASGEIFCHKKLTAASNHYKLGEWVKVTNVENGKSVYVLINDRMAKNSSRLIDLTQCAANNLCFMGKGLCKVNVERVPNEPSTELTNLENPIDSLRLNK
ncbi:MAG: septal ring lytic transglycosylase RlpA family protein [Bacteroidetes bacterium]|jgi:rare lipoprotein A|nr:septal ring lytic transglycosylase RlpA family protein [Bacteroidota bacterium]HQW45993.1 septal ring lytic transglycosylase RlpA family protein [Chitinophagaceae bacterium]MBK6819279.1 septal ring lytic transglycosylase RlpA family protein [Bacteroidota bacterium]MBK7041627.1 septal ring lytic transglycosylase RlpA family protein [Bacteroidota bacterium]MBK7588287.1 septal ring lytic transglycosylase RlpA family protein [Bacteroidota bacterium]